ncbi:uncharacterized protein A4U43_C07F9260 [Asparagus officinalis]|uniref:Uncharacterized protein n=1 Tax=Asparagus officinalis TaxID=4686 RepID=A0A5P1ECG2_ASPOF|nr:uncharacterized protein A4U43_C07F9260 [Asparagus officinalis]
MEKKEERHERREAAGEEQRRQWRRRKRDMGEEEKQQGKGRGDNGEVGEEAVAKEVTALMICGVSVVEQFRLGVPHSTYRFLIGQYGYHYSGYSLSSKMTAVGGFLMNKSGRRPLLLIFSINMKRSAGSLCDAKELVPFSGFIRCLQFYDVLELIR